MIRNQYISFVSKIEWNLIVIYLLMTLWGWLNIYATEFSAQAEFNLFNFNTYYGKQFLWLLISYITAFLIIISDARLFTTFAYVFYILFLLLLAMTIFVGVSISGTKSWIEFSDIIRIQPSELMKIGVILAISNFISKHGFSFNKIIHLVTLLSFIFIPIIIIILLNDAGSAIIYISFLFPFYRFGLSITPYIIGIWFIILFFLTLLVNKYILIAIVITLTLLLLWLHRFQRKQALTILIISLLSITFIFSVEFVFDKFLKPHQKDRFYVLLGKEVSPKGIGYNINQSLIAIGSGGFVGKGFLKGTQTLYNFVPEQRTDFIFCTIAEQWGFIGSILLLLLFLYLINRIISLSEKHRSLFIKVYGYSIASLIFLHFTINIGMTLNILPVIGITLPFFSYGGSSLLAFTIMIFIFIKLNTKT